jgi:hypothetical protein
MRFCSFFSESVKRKRPARGGTQTHSEVPHRRLLDERADDTAVSQYLYRELCIMRYPCPRAAAAPPCMHETAASSCCMTCACWLRVRAWWQPDRSGRQWTSKSIPTGPRWRCASTIFEWELVAALGAIVPNTGHSVDLNHLEGPPPTSLKVHFGVFWTLAGLLIGPIQF